MAAVGAAAVLGPAVARAATVAWTGTGGQNWATTTSWSPNGAGPGVTDTASFTDTGATGFLGDVTSVLNANRTVGGLAFNNTANKYHTLDLNGKTLTVNGNLHFNTDQSALSSPTIQNGVLVVNSAFGAINVARSGSGSADARAAVDLSGVSSFTATIKDVNIGVSASGVTDGTLSLGPSVNLTAQNVFVSASSSNLTKGTLRLGANTTFAVNDLWVGKDWSTGLVSIANNGTFNLGSASNRTNLRLGNVNLSSDNGGAGKLDLTGATFNAYLGDVIVGLRDGGGDYSAGLGTLIGGRAGSVDIGAAGNSANFYVGRMLTGGGSASGTGTVDFSGLATLTASLNAFELGYATPGQGSAQGTVSLAQSNTINALSIVVGSNGTKTNTLALGRTNVIQTNSLTLARGLANGTVTIPAGGSLALGSAAQRTDLTLGNSTVVDTIAYTGKMDLTGATLNAYLGNVTVGQKDGTGEYGQSVGILLAGGGGAVDIGAPGNTANLYVGHQLDGGGSSSSTGTVDFGGLSTLTARLNVLEVGTRVAGDGSAIGNLTLAQTSTVDARTITVGAGRGTSTLVLGRTSTVLANQLTIGKDTADATVSIPSGGSLALGSAARRADVFIGNGLIPVNATYTGKLDLTGATFTGYLGQLIVGQKDGTGQFGASVGTFIAGNAGSVDIGAAGNSANLYVGRMLAGGGNSAATGSVNFGGLSTLTANLNALGVGVNVAGTGVASGTLTLAQSNTISANTITVGGGGNGTSTLTLGKSNAIQATALTVGGDNANATVSLPAGGTLALGSAGGRVAVAVGTGNTSTNINNTYSATLDLSGGAVTAYLGNVGVGGKNLGQPGSKTGVLSIGTRPDNYVDAAAVTLADGAGSTGTFNFGGGAMVAASIAAGAGTANFNWGGGRLSVGQFGTATIPFALKNTGTGTLSPGAAPGAVATTTVFGAYTQAASATLAVDVAGPTPGAGNDLVSISGAATLAGNLNLALVGGFTPSVGQSFTVATYASRSGTFAYVAPPALPAGVALQLDYASPTQLVVRAVAPAGASFVSAAPAAAFAPAANWDTGATPGTATDASITNADPAARSVTVGADASVHAVWLQSTGGTLTLDVPAGVRLAAANRIVVGPSSVLRVAGSVADGGGVTVNAGGRFQATATQAVRALAVNDGGAAEVLGPGLTVLTTGALAVAPSGTLDLHAHAVVVEYAPGDGSPLGAPGAGGLRDRVAAAYHGGDWQGAGVGSAEVRASAGTARVLAVGYAEAADLLGPAGGTLDLGQGTSVALDPTAVVLRATLAGDADLNGTVGLNDLVKLANSYGTTGTATWTQGDFDYDGAVGLNDLVRLANNYGGALPTSPIPGAPADYGADLALAFDLAGRGPAPVPEPATAGGAAITAVGLLGRRARRRR